jgi:hypothetical protein
VGGSQVRLPSSRGLGHRPFTASTPVRIRSGAPVTGPLAQRLVRPTHNRLTKVQLFQGPPVVVVMRDSFNGRTLDFQSKDNSSILLSRSNKERRA